MFVSYGKEMIYPIRKCKDAECAKHGNIEFCFFSP